MGPVGRKRMRRGAAAFVALALLLLVVMVALLPTEGAQEAFKKLVPAFVFSVLAAFVIFVASASGPP